MKFLDLAAFNLTMLMHEKYKSFQEIADELNNQGYVNAFGDPIKQNVVYTMFKRKKAPKQIKGRFKKDPRKKAEKDLLETTTIRVSREVYKSLKTIRLGRKKTTFSGALDELIALSKRIESGEFRYVVGDKMFKDVAEARGESILESVQTQEPAKWPDIYVSIGKADPHAG